MCVIEFFFINFIYIYKIYIYIYIYKTIYLGRKMFFFVNISNIVCSGKLFFLSENMYGSLFQCKQCTFLCYFSINIMVYENYIKVYFEIYICTICIWWTFHNVSTHTFFSKILYICMYITSFFTSEHKSVFHINAKVFLIQLFFLPLH